MHEKRNFEVILLLLAAIIWSLLSWLWMNPDTAPLMHVQRYGSLVLVLVMTGWLIYAMNFEDKLVDHLRQTVGPVYYEVDGMSFLPAIRAQGRQAELCVYYQNRFENTAECVVHLRPPPDSFIICPGVRDVHFAFRAGGGDFGAIHQPIAIPEHLQGEVIDVHLAAASWYPRSHGARWRKEPGIPCGSLVVDWGGNPLKAGVHEVSGEIQLRNPTLLHVALPRGVIPYTTGDEVWRQEVLQPGPRA